jgi:hypothetical protein
MPSWRRVAQARPAILELRAPMMPVISIIDDDEGPRRYDGSFQVIGLHRGGFRFFNLQPPSSHILLGRGRADARNDWARAPQSFGWAGNIIPTILITAYPDDGDRVRALRAGVICYLVKLLEPPLSGPQARRLRLQGFAVEKLSSTPPLITCMSAVRDLPVARLPRLTDRPPR